MTVDLTKEERVLWASIDAMEKARALASLENDLVRKAEIDAWFKQHDRVIRPLRDKVEADEFDNPR